MHKSDGSSDDEDEFELEQAMMKRSEIRMRDRGEAAANHHDSLKQSVVGFGARLMSQSNMDSVMN